MGKKDHQVAFEEFAAEENNKAPLSGAIRGLGTESNYPLAAGTQKVDSIVEAILETVQRRLDEQKETNEPSNLRRLTSVDIRRILIPHIGDDKKGAISMLDVVTLGLTDIPDIKRFLKRHGSDLDNPRDLRYVNTVLQEATAYFDRVIAKNPKEKMNPLLKNTSNIDGISYIFQTAAGKHQRQLAPQACGLLRIAAVIDFLNRDPLLAVLPEAQAELKRIHDEHFYSVKGKTFFKTGTPGEIPMEVVKVELRTKERDSMITKLLHKPQNNTKELVDQMGMRVETRSAFEALKFLYFAFFKPDTAIFPGMTIRTDQTKQLLLDDRKLMAALQSPRKASALVEKLAVPTLDDSDLITISDQEGGTNQYSSKEYRAIQVTFDLPLTDRHGQKVNFPIEIQIVDKASRVVNDEKAPHTVYKKRQTAAVRDRVLGNNLVTRFAENKDKSDS